MMNTTASNSIENAIELKNSGGTPILSNKKRYKTTQKRSDQMHMTTATRESKTIFHVGAGAGGGNSNRKRATYGGEVTSNNSRMTSLQNLVLTGESATANGKSTMPPARPRYTEEAVMNKQQMSGAREPSLRTGTRSPLRRGTFNGIVSNESPHLAINISSKPIVYKPYGAVTADSTPSYLP